LKILESQRSREDLHCPSIGDMWWEILHSGGASAELAGEFLKSTGVGAIGELQKNWRVEVQRITNLEFMRSLGTSMKEDTWHNIY
jgi:hypothetical protein